MKKYGMKLAAGIGLLVLFFTFLGIAGDYDWAEDVIVKMSYAEYDWVKNTLTKLNGEAPSEREIAHWWEEHHRDYRE